MEESPTANGRQYEEPIRGGRDSRSPTGSRDDVGELCSERGLVYDVVLQGNGGERVSRGM